MTTPILTKKELTEAINLVAKYGTVAEAARQSGIPRTTLSSRLERAQGQGLYSKGKQSTTIEVIEELIEGRRAKKKLETVLSLEEIRKVLVTKDYKIKRRLKTSESTPVIVASDWHFEEQVLPESVENVNEFNLTVAKRRVDLFFNKAIRLLEIQATGTSYSTLILALLGDFITGYIHEEFLETNQLSPTQALNAVFEKLVSGIKLILESGLAKDVVVVCSCGNHSRTTQKQRVSTSVQNSYEWLLYIFLAKYFKGYKNIKFKLPSGYFTYLQVYDYVCRFHHGDNVRYQGGVGGVHIPLNKAIAQWNRAKTADLDVLGHWHTLKSDVRYVINGSLIGYAPYSIKIKADYEPPKQAFFLIHPKYGKTIEAPIFVEDANV